MASVTVKKFGNDANFCGQCGSLLPAPEPKVGHVVCGSCKKKWATNQVRNQLISTYRYEYPRLDSQPDDPESNPAARAAGPTVNRKCAKCGSDSMSYATRQTRSADEGMTVFFTCTKCGHKDIEYT